GESPDLSFDEKVVIGGILIDDVLTAKIAEENLPEDQRVPFVLGIDESGEFLGEDLQRALGAVRKYKLSIVLAAQDLSTFVRGDLDLSAKLLAMCGTVFVFRMTLRTDKEILADRLGAENIDFTPRMVEVQRQRGIELVPTQRITFAQGRSREEAHSESNTEAETLTNSTSNVKTQQ